MQSKWFYYGIAIVASLVYLALSFFTPQNPSATRFGLNAQTLFILRFTIAIPYMFTWFFAMYGLYALGRYLRSAKKREDTMYRVLRSVRTGFIWVASGTILVALVGGMRQYFLPSSLQYSLLTIVVNYLYAFPALIGFAILSRGISKLQSLKEVAIKKQNRIFNTFIVLIISVFYLFLIFTNPSRQFPTNPSTPATYFLPDPLIILTVVLPILATWWLGFYVAFSMGDIIPYFITKTEVFKGTTRVLYGIWAIIFTSILIQSLLSIGVSRLYTIGIGPLLLIIYIFIFLQGIGYFFLALGANTLMKSTEK